MKFRIYTFFTKIMLNIFIKLRSVSIVSSEDTLDYLSNRLSKSEPTAYLRFGDGDIFLLHNKSARNQGNSKKLSDEYKECFSLTGVGILKSIPIHSNLFGYDEGMKEGEHFQSDQIAKLLLALTYNYFVGCQIYSPVALHYALVYNKVQAKQFFSLLRNKEPLFVGGEFNEPEIVKSLLGATDIITTPAKNAYTKIDSIYADIIKKLDERANEFDVVILSCGSTAKLLTLRLLNNNRNIFIFDLGSVIDVFHGRDSWAWVKQSGLTLEQLNYFLANEDS